MVAFPLSIVFLGSLLSPSYQQQCLPSAQSSRPCEFSEDLPESLVLEVQDTLGRATVGGSYQKVQGCFHNGAPLYSQNTIRREARQAPRMVFPEARPTPASLYLGEGGRWRLGSSQASPAYVAETIACTPLRNSSGLWREEVPGKASSRLVTVLVRVARTWPLYYHVTGAPLDTVGYYGRTELQMGGVGSEAPVYSKPGIGSSKLYLFSYKGSWVVAKDPFAGPTTMQYRMFQDSSGSDLPLDSLPWTVKTNSGGLREDAGVNVLPVYPFIPAHFNVESPGVSGAGVGGRYVLVSNITETSTPVYRQQGGQGLYLFQVIFELHMKSQKFISWIYIDSCLFRVGQGTG